jgi:hypothetical protein
MPPASQSLHWLIDLSLPVPVGRTFLLNLSGVSQVDAGQEHSNEGFAAAQRGFAMAAATVQNCKTLSMGSNPIVASESKRFTEKFR